VQGAQKRRNRHFSLNATTWLPPYSSGAKMVAKANVVEARHGLTTTSI
jgi:hypothetical protein